MTNPPKGAQSLVQQVVRGLETDIQSGVLAPGQILPPTSELANQWQVSSFTINTAMKELQKRGLIESKARSKRTVAARALSQPRTEPLKPPQPTAVLIGGYAGTGKSELGRMLAHETGWALVDKDTITRPLVEMALETMGQSPHDRESDTYLSTVRPREYEAMSMTAEENITAGSSVILSAPYLKEFMDVAWLHRTKSMLEAAGARVVFVWVRCDVESMYHYLRRRGAARDTHKLSNWKDYCSNLQMDFRPTVEHLLVDNSLSAAPLKDQAHHIVRSLAH